MLVRDAQAGRFELLLAEALDRISRDQADIATLYKQLKFCGVPIVTLAEGTISELHVGLKGTMNALFLQDLALKTRRGLRGRVERGKSGGGLCYGYRVVSRLDASGNPVTGERAIDAEQAAVIRRIYHDFAAGVSPRAIAKSLNDQGIAGPAGRPCGTTPRCAAMSGAAPASSTTSSTSAGCQRYVKDPASGCRASTRRSNGLSPRCRSCASSTISSGRRSGRAWTRSPTATSS
jgi:site-specific DNA recombinase